MLDIGVFAPYGTHHDRNLALCRDTDVHHIVLSAYGIAGDRAAGLAWAIGYIRALDQVVEP